VTIVERLRRQIAAQQPVDDRHAGSIVQFLEALDRLADPLDEAADPTHVTASAVVVGPRGTVLHRHKRLGLWLQPGGHIDPDEDPEDAALREVREETGLRVHHPDGGAQLFHVDVHPAGEHVHLDLRYLVGGDDADPAPQPGESPDARWFEWAEAIAVADVALVGALRAMAGGNSPPQWYCTS
jgi:8-oxo-dGTP pyrophosphatase MutT (NUDIX family)